MSMRSISLPRIWRYGRYIRALAVAAGLSFALCASLIPAPLEASASHPNAGGGATRARSVTSTATGKSAKTPSDALNTIQIGTDGWSGETQTSDAQTGWGDDQWQYSLTSLYQVSVTVQDEYIVGDNYTVFVDGKSIGTTPPEPYQGTTYSSGTFTALSGPGTHTITIQDPGAVAYYQQGDTDMIPAGYSVQIQFQSATIPQSVIFVHGIGEKATDMGTSEFAPLYADIQQLTGNNPVTYAYVDDRAGGKYCTQQPCVSQSAVTDNARSLARLVNQVYGAGPQKVALIGYSMGGAIIRSLLDGCPLTDDPACVKAVSELNDVFFINGVQQGSITIGVLTGTEDWLTDSPVGLAGGMTLSIALDQFSQILAQTTLHLNPDGAAEQDLTPQTDNILLHDDKNPPSGLNYYNFYGDIHLAFSWQLYGPVTPSPAGSGWAVGDLVILPGNDNPILAPSGGGAQICLRCASQNGYSSSQVDANTTYTEWAMSDTVVVSPQSVAACLPTLSKLVGGSCFSELFSAPEMHTVIPHSDSLAGPNAIQVADATGATQTATIPDEIVMAILASDGVNP